MFVARMERSEMRGGLATGHEPRIALRSIRATGCYRLRGKVDAASAVERHRNEQPRADQQAERDPADGGENAMSATGRLGSRSGLLCRDYFDASIRFCISQRTPRDHE
jgi:hypothetical protein